MAFNARQVRDREIDGRELKERVVEINRVAKVVKGGRRFSFTALVVIGDEVDRVGVGYGKAREVPLAISKAVDDAKKNLFQVPKHGQTITHEVLGALGRRARPAAARRAREPASSPAAACAPCSSSPGSATSWPRASGTRIPINLLKATVNGLKSLRRPEEVGRIRGKRVEDILFPAVKKKDEPEEAPAATEAPAAEPAPEEPAAEAQTATETDDSGEAADNTDA